MLIGEVKVGTWVAYYNYQIPTGFLLFYSTDEHRSRTLSYSVLQQYMFVHKGFFPPAILSVNYSVLTDTFFRCASTLEKEEKVGVGVC